MAENPLKESQVSIGAPTGSLVASTQAAASDTVVVSAANIVMADGRSGYRFNAASSSAFSALGAGQVDRWDALCLDATLPGPPVLEITQGTPNVGPGMNDWWDGMPSIPLGRVPIAIVHVTEVSPASVVVSSSDITDLRGFFETPRIGATYADYTPGTDTDWVAVPTEVTSALDELADRLNSGAAGVVLDPSTGDPGTSKNASRSDHVHPHGDQSGTATTHHDTEQTKYTPGVAGDWLTPLAPPAEVTSGLDELADRLNTDVTPADVSGTAAATGTSKVAARADHVHDHGDESEAAATHHGAPQVSYAPVIGGNWATPNPATVKEGLDQLAQRSVALQLVKTGYIRLYEAGAVPAAYWINSDGVTANNATMLITMPSPDYYPKQIHIHCVSSNPDTGAGPSNFGHGHINVVATDTVVPSYRFHSLSLYHKIDGGTENRHNATETIEAGLGADVSLDGATKIGSVSVSGVEKDVGCTISEATITIDVASTGTGAPNDYTLLDVTVELAYRY